MKKLIFMTLLLFGCKPLPFPKRAKPDLNVEYLNDNSIKRVCVYGVSYLVTQSALDGKVLTLQVNSKGQPVLCKLEE